jgi:hypothetical protein
MYVQPFDGSLSPNSLSPLVGSMEGEGLVSGAAASSTEGDNISRLLPPWPGGGAEGTASDNWAYATPGSMQGMFGSLMGMLAQLMQMLQSMMGNGCNERFFQNAAGSSEGDPHLSFDGNRWNSMVSQPDLLNSNSFTGGFQISTRVTPPDGKGATWNQSATISLNNGMTTIGLNSGGEPSITNCGQSISIAPGQTLQLGNGVTVGCGQNGSLCVTAQNGAGGQISTTLTAAGRGVNVDVTAHDVNLGGALVNGDEGQPVSGPIRAPIPAPIVDPFSIGR